MRPVILFLSHPEKECGVHEFGRQVFSGLAGSTRYRFVYQEVRTVADLQAAIAREAPALLLVNWHPLTMPQLPIPALRATGLPTVGLLHEVTSELADTLPATAFHWYVTHDPTLSTRNPLVFRAGRPLLPFQNRQPPPALPTIGTFGFATPGKGFEGLVARVQAEFDTCLIRMSLPPSRFCDPDGAEARRVAQRCRQVLHKPGIQLEVSHSYRSIPQVLEFLAGNSMNAFFYESQTGRGLSSAVDLALAADRPLALRRTPMFRHLFGVTPSIFVEERSLAEILREGPAPLAALRQQWTMEAVRADYERLLDRILGPALDAGAATPVYPAMAQAAAGRGFAPRVTRSAPRPDAGWPPPVAPGAGPPGHLNRVLDDQARALYRPVVEELFRIAPATMARKIPAANVQQAYVFETVRRELAGRRGARVLCVGAFEDTAAEGVRTLGHPMDEIDPALNFDLDAFCRRPETRPGTYHVIFSTSVIEHVEDDETFVAQIAGLLAPGGLAVITCDFNDAYQPGDRVPQEDFRFYTSRDLGVRLLSRMPGCALADAPAWSHGPPDFCYAGIPYMFAALAVRKLGPAASAVAPPASRFRVTRAGAAP